MLSLCNGAVRQLQGRGTVAESASHVHSTCQGVGIDTAAVVKMSVYFVSMSISAVDQLQLDVYEVTYTP